MKSSFNSLLFTIILFLSCSGSKKISIVSDQASLETVKSERNVFLKEATFYGLQKDQFPVEIANTLVEEKSIWVVKCPICDNVKRGFQMYTNSNSELRKTKLSDDYIWKLIDQDMIVKKTALRDLIDNYVQQYYSVLKMTKGERQTMQILLEEGREKGMDAANGGAGFFGASCDGACHKKE